jgi:hypothetical protein
MELKYSFNRVVRLKQIPQRKKSMLLAWSAQHTNLGIVVEQAWGINMTKIIIPLGFSTTWNTFTFTNN